MLLPQLQKKVNGIFAATDFTIFIIPNHYCPVKIFNKIAVPFTG